MTFDFVDDAGHEVVDLTADADTLKRALDAIINVDEVKLHFNGGGLSVKYTDPAHVMINQMTVPPEALAEYELTDPTTVGTNVDRLMTTLRPARVTANDEIRLNVHTEEMDSYVNRSYGDDAESTYHTQWKLIDPDSIREEPDPPDLDLTEVDVDLTQLHDAVSSVGGPFDHVRIETIEEGLRISGNDDTHGTEATIHGDIPDGINAIYSSDYLTDIADAVKGLQADSVTLKAGEEFPLVVDWGRDDGVEGTYMLAPRVED